MIAASGCDTEDVNTNDPLTGYALGDGKTLMLLPWGRVLIISPAYRSS